MSDLMNSILGIVQGALKADWVGMTAGILGTVASGIGMLFGKWF